MRASQPRSGRHLAYGHDSSDPEGVSDLLAREDNRKLIAYLRLLSNREDSLAWATLIHFCPGVGPRFFEYVYESAKVAGSQFGQAFLALGSEDFDGGPQGSADRAVAMYAETIGRLNACELPDAGDAPSWTGWIDEQVQDEYLPLFSDELRELLSGVEDLIDEQQELGRFVSQVAPLGKDLAQAESGGVRFMSMASSKGLTVEATIVVGVDQALIPRHGVEIQEERRLLYVAMTRSRRDLYLTYARRRFGPQQHVNQGGSQLRNPTLLLEDSGVSPQSGSAYLESIGA